MGSDLLLYAVFLYLDLCTYVDPLFIDQRLQNYNLPLCIYHIITAATYT